MARSAKTLFHGRTVAAVAAFVASALAGTTQAATLAVGPVEQINARAETLVVLGQTYHVGSSVAIKSAAGTRVPLVSLQSGELVVVDGTESPSGQAAVSGVTSLPQLDVPGATQLLVTGVVSSESPTGQIKVGNLVVDINATLTSDVQNFAVGSLVKVAGTQPNPGGVFLAQTIAPSSTQASSNGIAGTGLSSNGIAGTGLSSNGIAGTGLSSNGIAGTGLSNKGIAGTGYTRNGIAGTGFNRNGIAGTGFTRNGIAGTGLSNKGIAGTGYTRNGIAGTGFNRNGIAGTGFTRNGIAGTGRK